MDRDAQGEKGTGILLAVGALATGALSMAYPLLIFVAAGLGIAGYVKGGGALAAVSIVVAVICFLFGAIITSLF